MSDITPKETPGNSIPIHALAEFARNKVLDKNSKPAGVKMTMFISEWFPSFRWSTEPVLRFLSNTFSEIADKFETKNKRKPVMVDLGAGEGMVTFVASATGKYKHCYGIEYRGNVVDWGKENQRELESNNMLPAGNIDLITGSYYTKQTWQSMKGKIEDEDYSDPKNQIHALEKAKLLDNDGKLKADVVYWFPSDPYMEFAIDQWKTIFKSGTYLILGPSGQKEVLQNMGVLDEFDLVEKKIRPSEGKNDEFTFRDVAIYKKK